MACRGCGQKSAISKELRDMYNSAHKRVIAKNRDETYDDGEFVRCVYKSAMSGDHQLIGSVTKINYGYRSRGDKILVHREDVKVNPHLFEPVGHVVEISSEDTAPPPPPEPKPIDEIQEEKVPEPNPVGERMEESLTEEKLAEFGATRNTKGVLDELNTLGVNVVGKLPTLTLEELTEIKGIGETTARKIKNNAVKYINTGE